MENPLILLLLVNFSGDEKEKIAKKGRPCQVYQSNPRWFLWTMWRSSCCRSTESLFTYGLLPGQ